MSAETVNLSLEFIFETSDIKKVKTEFSKELFKNKFFLNKKGLIFNSEKVLFSRDDWVYNPQKFCLDQYNEPDLHHIILLVNDIFSIFSFKRENFPNGEIIAPSIQSIIDVLTFRT